MPEAAPQSVAGPASGSAIDYSKRDYEGLRAAMLRELARSIPTAIWGHPADPMTVLVEALAAAGDYLSYRLDIVATEAYLATARLRSSVRRHARLLDYRLDDGCSARTWLTFEVSKDCVLPAHTLAATIQDGLAEAVIPPGRTVGFGGATIFFETVSPALLRVKDLVIQASGTCLPAGAAETVIAAPARPLNPGDLLIFQAANAAQVVRLVEVVPIDKGLVRIVWGPEDALTADLPLDGLRASSNVVLADHGRGHVFPLDEEDTVIPPFADISCTPPAGLSSAWSAASAAAPDPRAARPDIVLAPHSDADGDWICFRDLIGSGPFERLFTAEREESGRIRLRFGDGLFGREPGRLADASVTVRQGLGSVGNVPAGSVRHVVTNRPVTAIAQPFAAVGGTEPETEAAARLYAPAAFRDPVRIASAEDAAIIAARHKLVSRATATVSGRSFAVHIDPPPSVPFERAQAAVQPVLEAALVIGSSLDVHGPVALPIDVTLNVHPADGYDPDLLLARLGARFAASPGGLLFGIDYPMGAPVFFSDLIAAVLAVEGAGWVDLAGTGTVFAAQMPKPGPGDGLAAGFIAPGPSEVAVAGRVRFSLAGSAGPA